jgi:FkbM family methyltransferase
MNGKCSRSRLVGKLRPFARRASTLFSIAQSAAKVWQDGIDPWRMGHDERLQYLDLQPALGNKKGVIVYDIGAHHGEFASFLAKIRNVSMIYCFEPVPEIFSQLVKKTREFGNVECFQVGLGNQSGKCQMYVNDFTASSSLLRMGRIHVEEKAFTQNTHEEEVQMVTLEEAVQMYKLPHPDFIKIDVQGYEDRVIRGGENIVRKAKYCMLELSLVELYEEGVLIAEMNSMMRRLGFRLIKMGGKIVGRLGEILQVDGIFRNEMT